MNWEHYGRFFRTDDRKLNIEARPPYYLGEAEWSRPWEYAFVQDNIKGQRTCLDVGSGTSILPGLLREWGTEPTCVDPDVEALRYQADRGFAIFNSWDRIQGYRADNADAAGFRFPVVLCISVMEHVEDLGLVAKQMFDSTVPGGRLLVTMDIPRRLPEEVVRALTQVGYDPPTWIELRPCGECVAAAWRDRWTSVPGMEGELFVWAGVFRRL